MHEKRRFILLAIIMAAAIAGVTGSTLFVLYRTAFHETRGRLIEIAQSRVGLLETMAEDRMRAAGGTLSQTAVIDILRRVQTAVDNHFMGFSRTGEFTLARRRGENINFLLRFRHSPSPAPGINETPFQAKTAEPMRRALEGKTGTLIGPDYRGENVLAAFAPVKGLGWGVVVKVDLSEVRQPFIRAGFQAGGIALILIFLGAILFRHISFPLLRNLENSERRLRAIIDSAVDGIITTNEAGIILSLNKSAEKMFGYTADEVLGQGVNILMPNPFKDGHDGYIQSYLDTGEKKIIGTGREVTGLRKDGSEFPVSLAVSEVRLDDRTIFTGLIRDLSEQKKMEAQRERLEAQLHQAQRLETIGTLSSGIAHDFNNILASILGHAELALQEISDNPVAREDIGRVIESAERARDLIQQILTFSRQAATDRSSIPLQYIVHEALNLLRASLPSTVEIHEYINGNCRTVYADATQIHQVVMNLAVNAGHAMRENAGRLEVHLEPFEATAAAAQQYANLREGNYVRLTVSDTGHGMGQKTIDRLFEPFFTTKEVGEGTGLGLSVVHGIVMSHGGEITVYSEPGKGSTFNVYFPLSHEEAPASKPHSEIAPAGSERILLVEDEEEVAGVAKRMLENLGYRVSVKHNGADALEAFRAAPESFDLLVTDETMPRMTGSRLAAEIAHMRPDFPVILTTGFSSLDQIANEELPNIREIVMKPFAPRELGAAIRRAFR
ncbi:MAG: PAS domain S-box protein [bacterium]|nr:PAS domain S-box protein [bacterium]